MPTYPQGKVVVVRVGLELVELVEPVVLVLPRYSVVDVLREGRRVRVREKGDSHIFRREEETQHINYSCSSKLRITLYTRFSKDFKGVTV